MRILARGVAEGCIMALLLLLSRGHERDEEEEGEQGGAQGPRARSGRPASRHEAVLIYSKASEDKAWLRPLSGQASGIRRDRVGKGEPAVKDGRSGARLGWAGGGGRMQSKIVRVER